MAGADCAGCGDWSERVHSSYLRFPADVPSAGKRVRLCLRVRRFVCENALCERRTFVEQIAGLTRRHGRWTERLRSTLAAVGLALAGRAGARMASVFGVALFTGLGSGCSALWKAPRQCHCSMFTRDDSTRPPATAAPLDRPSPGERTPSSA
ncbi:transposase family protein [Streptomyces sp. NBC_00841]|uniref:transposase family protein n=1 Tax=unclassified Streptomyces TaxID=2593676 RepID=UPI00225079E1|nr:MULTISPECIES: transposase family protein [unclassified Streptomyces]MCX4530039.1 transposase family protein [Streptomyces sp. NBC_01669]WSA04697.1 transposase family protein [Streptomyces sp. NBC_00841]